MQKINLVEAFQNGDKQALIVLYRHNVKDLFRFIRKRVSSTQEAEDLTQDVFLEVCRTLKKAKIKKSFRSWLFGIATTKVKAHWQAKYRMPLVAIEPLLQTKQLSYKQSEFVLTKEDLQDKAQMVRRLLHVLPDKQAWVIRLRFDKGYSRKETAKELRTTENNIKVWQYRAPVSLRKYMSEVELEPHKKCLSG